MSLRHKGQAISLTKLYLIQTRKFQATYYLDVDSLVDLPNLNQKSNKTTDNDNGVGLIIHNIQKNNDRLENIEEYRSHRQAFQGLSASPELYV